ncbi:hypothetical protein PFICI_07028 [Pestalotiopsis fici W106-1]|uniref:Uncharacterized protein n=1 Tax=Pestalotiopsis fici (strain W106-1 / CGMCC3.15140) TaxID=1229662 RepID=W3XA24_PESFW|nr:uncharacterized protein PFICI_07028 [Pestalotiopsis fici W106-1]ETS82026.1 hypothetical protein PFICI_07028 [Pestalotiopsis fici W106-1]
MPIFHSYQITPFGVTSRPLENSQLVGSRIVIQQADRQVDEMFEEMWTTLGRPSVMLVDLRPVSPPMLLVTSHSIAEQISRPSQQLPFSTPKSSTWTHMIPIIGKTSILGKEGQEWKDLRKKYNPGFMPQHLLSLMPLILAKMEPFWNHLNRSAAANAEFSLEELIANLTFDVIGVTVLEVQLNAQHLNPSEQDQLVHLFRPLLQTYKDDKNNFPWWMVPLTTFKRHRLAKKIDVLVKDKIKHKYSDLKNEAEENGSKSILALSLRDTEALTPQLLSEMSDQVRTFLFAGYDTTSSMLQWLLYELSRTPRALKAVRDELDEVLGPQTDPERICASLLENGHQLMTRMHYINAAIKETLRLYPPASTARMTGPRSGFTISTAAGEDYNVDGLVMYSCQKIIHRDPAVFGDTADDWEPERWLGDAAKSIPAGAWRPFERGPRACIGTELANLEARLIVAIVARKYDFIKTGLGASALDKEGQPMLDEKGQYQVKSKLYNTRRMTAQPVDGTMMKVKAVVWPKD